MATTVARLQAILSAQTRDFDKAMTHSEGRMRSLGKAGAVAAGAAGVGAIAITLRAGIKEYVESQKATAQTNAVIKSTGGIAKITAKHVEDLAESMMKKTGIDDEAIQTSENLLLGFTNIRNELGKGNDVFDRTTRLVQDYSTRTGKSAVTASIAFGKALNDPIKGMGALGRAGIILTDAQKKTIKSFVDAGEPTKAQTYLLGLMETRFKGAAEAAGKTLPGQINIAKETFNNFAADLVAKAIPVIENVIGWLRDHWPEIRTALKTFWKDVKPLLDGLFKLLSAIYIFIRDHWAQIGPIVRTVSDIVGAALRVLGGTMKVFAALLRGDWSEAWKSFKDVIKAVGDLIESYFRPQVYLLKTAFEKLKDAGTTVWNAIKDAAEKVEKPFKAAAGVIHGAIREVNAALHAMVRALEKIVNLFKWIIDNVKKIGGALGGIGGAVGGAVGKLNPFGEGEGRPAGGGGFPGGSGNMGSIVQAANVIDSRHFPYVWGGGHSAATYGGPYDCSGAVSALLRAGGLLSGAMVSGDFMNWGRAGMGKHLSILANKEHVYAIINGKAWGTSGQNPHGGAGWFSGGVRPGFAIRHPEGFDTGGWLKPGLTLAMNNTGRPERVVSGNGDNVVIPVNIGGENVATIIFDMLRRQAKVFENRNGRPAFGGA